MRIFTYYPAFSELPSLGRPETIGEIIDRYCAASPEIPEFLEIVVSSQDGRSSAKYVTPGAPKRYPGPFVGRDWWVPQDATAVSIHKYPALQGHPAPHPYVYYMDTKRVGQKEITATFPLHCPVEYFLRQSFYTQGAYNALKQVEEHLLGDAPDWLVEQVTDAIKDFDRVGDDDLYSPGRISREQP